MAFTPTSAYTPATPEGLREYSRFTKNFVMDRPIIDLFSFQNFVEHDDNTEGMGTGAPEFGEIGTSSIGGIKMTNSDTYGHLLVIPYWADPGSQWDWRLAWSNSEAAATGSVLYAVTYSPVSIVAKSTALAAGATALDTPIASQVDLAANVPQWTQWGVLNADTAAIKNLVPATDMLSVEITATLSTIADASVLGAQYRVARKYL